jgi:tetratricopeptide (TPR) repeat protein
MSLLMQALKKAEQTKQKQSELLIEPSLSAGSGDAKPAVEFSIETPSPILHEEKNEPAYANSPSLGLGLSLTPHVDEDVPAASAMGMEASTAEASLTKHMVQEKTPEKVSNTTEADLEDDSKAFLNHDRGMPKDAIGVETPAAIGQDPVDVVSGNKMNAAEKKQAAAREAHAVSSSQQKAKAIFTSKKPQYHPSRRSATLMGVTTLILLLGVGYYYWNSLQQARVELDNSIQTATLPPVQSPLEMNAVDSSKPLANPEQTNASPTPAPHPEVNPATALASTIATTSSAAATTASATMGSTMTKSSALIDKAAQLNVPANTEANESNNESRNSSATESKSKAGRTALAKEISAIQIKKSNIDNKINPSLSSAYQFFIVGDTNAAEPLYQKVLTDEPNNRDALVGLAAIALNRRQADRAAIFYAKLLELNPYDPEAIAGLNSLQQGDPVQSESHLKKALNQNPNSSAILFGLGNLYAQQSRWSDAQQNFFRAYAITPNNADYAFNLAVSLDRLSQSKLAIDYYQRALVLGQSGPGNFNQNGVQKRIKELEAAIHE